MNRYWVVGPLGFILFLSIVTWHPFMAGLSLVAIAITWEIADNGIHNRLLKEIEKYANEHDDDGH